MSGHKDVRNDIINLKIVKLIMIINMLLSGIYFLTSWAKLEYIYSSWNGEGFIIAIFLMNSGISGIFAILLINNASGINRRDNKRKIFSLLPHYGIMLGLLVFPNTISSEITIGGLENSVNKATMKGLDDFSNFISQDIPYINLEIEDRMKEKEDMFSSYLLKNTDIEITQKVLSGTNNKNSKYIVGGLSSLKNINSDSPLRMSGFFDYNFPRGVATDEILLDYVTKNVTDKEGSTTFENNQEQFFANQRNLGVFERNDFKKHSTTFIEAEIVNPDILKEYCYNANIVFYGDTSNDKTILNHRYCGKGEVKISENLFTYFGNFKFHEPFSVFITEDISNPSASKIKHIKVEEYNGASGYPTICLEAKNKIFPEKSFRKVIGHREVRSFLVFDTLLETERGSCSEINANNFLQDKVNNE